MGLELTENGSTFLARRRPAGFFGGGVLTSEVVGSWRTRLARDSGDNNKGRVRDKQLEIGYF